MSRVNRIRQRLLNDAYYGSDPQYGPGIRDQIADELIDAGWDGTDDDLDAEIERRLEAMIQEAMEIDAESREEVSHE